MSDSASTQPLRVAGSLLLFGVVLTFVGAISRVLVGGVGTANRTGWVLIHLALVLGAALGLLGFPAVYARQAKAVGRMGLVGFGLFFIGFLGIGFFTPTAEALLVPWVYDRASCTLGCHLLDASAGPPLLGWFYRVEFLATFVGLIALGLPTARAAIFPPGAGYLMVIAGLLGLPLVVVGLTQWYELVTTAIALLGFGWIALDLITQPSGTRQPAASGDRARRR